MEVDKNKKKEETCEIFELEKRGKKKTVESCATSNVPDEHASKKQIEKENKILRNIFIGIGVIILLIIGIVLFVNHIRHYNYHGVDFETVKEQNLLLYKVSVPVTYGNGTAEYNFYLRTNPKLLENVSFEGEITTRRFMVINTTNELNCGGYGGLGIANIVKLYDLLGVKSMADKNASCDQLGAYTYLNIIPGNETKIEQYGPSCYKISVSSCDDILPATEKFMAETFVSLNNYMKNQTKLN